MSEKEYESHLHFIADSTLEFEKKNYGERTYLLGALLTDLVSKLFQHIEIGAEDSEDDALNRAFSILRTALAKKR